MTVQDFAVLNVSGGQLQVGVNGGTGTLTVTGAARVTVAAGIYVGNARGAFGGGTPGNGTMTVGAADGSDSPTVTSNTELQSAPDVA